MPDHAAEAQKWDDREQMHRYEQLSFIGKDWKKAENARMMRLLCDHLYDCAVRGEQHTPPCVKWLSEYKELWNKTYKTVPSVSKR